MNDSPSRPRRIALLACGASACIAMAGCSGGGVDVADGGPTNASGGSGGTVVAALNGEPDQLDPGKTTDATSSEVLDNVMETLVRPDANLRMVPGLATSWTTSPDQLTWTFQLRTTDWQDGSPFTSADVVYTYNRIIDQKLPQNYRLTTVKSVTAAGQHTAVFTLTKPTPNLLVQLGGLVEMGIEQRANVESGAVANKPMGTGPFRVVSWQHGASITLAANPHYWGGTPHLSGVKFTFVSDPTVALQDLESGEAQWTDNLPPQQVPQLLKSAGNGIAVRTVPGANYWYLNLNEAHKPYDDKRVRQAIAYAIDRDAVMKAATFGSATVNQAAIPKVSGWYDRYAPYTHDPAKARSLLAEAGVHDLSIDMIATSQYPASVSAAQVIASELGEVGITVRIRTLDFPTWLTQEGAGQWDAYVLTWVGTIDPNDYYYSQHRTGASFNFQKYSNPAVDALLDEQAATADPGRRKDIVNRAMRMIVDDASYIYLYNLDEVEGHSDRLHGNVLGPDASVRFANASVG